MSWKAKSHSSLNHSNTELHSYELSQRTPVKDHSNTNNYSNIHSRHARTPQSTSSIRYRYELKKKEDPQTAELILSAKFASDKSRDILYTSTMKPSSPSLIKNDEWKPSNYSPSTEVDTSSIKGFESHVLRIRTPPKKKAIPSPSSKIIIMPNAPKLTPSKQDKDKLINEIDMFLEKLENENGNKT